MSTRDAFTSQLSKNMMDFIESEKYENLTKAEKEEELKTYFNKIYDTIQEMADSTLEELTKNGIDIMTKEDFNSLEDEQNRGWTQGLFILLLISFGSSTLNNIFNILPKFSFLESFGLLLLLINVYSLISIYLFKR
jgi:hypothetical protein